MPVHFVRKHHHLLEVGVGFVGVGINGIEKLVNVVFGGEITHSVSQIALGDEYLYESLDVSFFQHGFSAMAKAQVSMTAAVMTVVHQLFLCPTADWVMFMVRTILFEMR